MKNLVVVNNLSFNYFNKKILFDIDLNIGEASNLNPEGLLKSQSRVWVPLIWNAFNFLNYDVPETWLNIDLEEDNKKKNFKYIKKII